MAELAAIGLASNLLQFAELGIKLFILARETHRTGTTSKHGALKSEIESVKKMAKVTQFLCRTSDKNDITLQLDKLVKECDDIADAVLDFLHKISTNIDHREKIYRRLWSSLEQALATLSYEKKTLGFEKRLEKLKADLQFYIVAASVENFMSAVEQFRQAKAIVERQHDILESLRFDKLRAREIAIPKNHKKTFKWIFQEDVTKFPQWLQSEEGIFWIRGKAGSGKSTLMKFLVSQEGLRDLTPKLQVWGGNSRVVTTSHYFWHAGNSMQKSQRGLLQTLLFGILKELPSRIETLLELMAAFDALASNQNKDLPVNFCFLIDGLDEYTGGAERYHGQFEDLLTTLYKLASLPSVKLCVSSRPWPAFNESLGPRVGERYLQVEDLTRDDIKRVVIERLESSANYKRLLEQDARCSGIPAEIVRRAQGVFLWVHLIVKSLTDGMANADKYNLLRKRLDEIPDDLESYFRQMVENREKVYGDHTIRLFKTMIESAQALPLLAIDFLDTEEFKEQYAFEMGIESLSKHDVRAKLADLERQVNARGGDLLYVSPTEDDFLRFQVDFLHRTVRDFFLETNVMDEIKVSDKVRKFNALPSLCNIMLALSKTVPYSNDILQVDFNQVFRYADGLMHYAWKAEDNYTHVSEESSVSSERHKSALERTYRCLDALVETNIQRLNRDGVHWTNRKDTPRGNFKESNKKTFLASAIQARLSLYVKHKIAESPSYIKSKGGRPLLDYALRPTMITAIEMTAPEGPISSLVQLLLRHGDDPNKRLQAYGGKTPWELFLNVCYRHSTREDKYSVHANDIMVSMVEMILHGAESSVTVETEGGDRIGILEVALGLDLSSNQIERRQSEKQQSRLSGVIMGLMSYIWPNEAQ
ncbi:hypothetical protein LZ32DRAFT_638470 [Colletotrichum eremochloae]|nr:hypothetical protein LZ32DRAFT_638470 [Colletotrichum eremochloae]